MYTPLLTVYIIRYTVKSCRTLVCYCYSFPTLDTIQIVRRVSWKLHFNVMSVLYDWVLFQSYMITVG